jgi:hypothetical protein
MGFKLGRPFRRGFIISFEIFGLHDDADVGRCRSSW